MEKRDHLRVRGQCKTAHEITAWTVGIFLTIVSGLVKDIIKRFREGGPDLC